MHSLIYILVETASKADAISEAADILTDLCGANPGRLGPHALHPSFPRDLRGARLRLSPL